eukprot:7837060-Pyramimonas_sp.AAC.1
MGKNSQGTAYMRNIRHGGKITDGIGITAMLEKATKKDRRVVCLTFLPFRVHAILQGPRCMARSANIYICV